MVAFRAAGSQPPANNATVNIAAPAGSTLTRNLARQQQLFH
jgi:hypothetical protein